MKLLIFLFLFGLQANALEKTAFMHESDNQKTLWIKDSAGNLEKVDVGFGFAIYPFLSKDATELAFVAGQDENSLNIYIKNLVTGQQEKITSQAGFVIHPSLSGDSRYLSYSQMENGRNHIVVVDRKKHFRSEIHDDNSLYFPRMSSNGNFIVYQKTLDRDHKEIRKHSFLEDKDEKISVGYEKCMSPNLNNDDSLLAMTCYQDKKWNIYVADLNTKSIQQVTFTSFESFAPAFDRKSNIIFASNETGHFVLHKLKRQNNGTYLKASEVFEKMDGDLYAPSASGELSYQRTQPTNVYITITFSFEARWHPLRKTSLKYKARCTPYV